MELLCEKLRRKICKYFSQSQNIDSDTLEIISQAVIAFNTKKLQEEGDLSFPTSSKFWINKIKSLKQSSVVSLKENAFSIFEQETEVQKKQRQDLCEELSKIIPISRMLVNKDRCMLFLERPIVMNCLLRQVLGIDKYSMPFGHVPKDQQYRLYLHEEQWEADDLLPIYRAKLLRGILRRLLAYTKWNLMTEPVGGAKDALNVRVESVYASGLYREDEGGQRDWVIIKCGIVIDPQTGKLCTQTTEEYFGLRSNDLSLMARHKYGNRSKEERFRQLIEKLGAAAVNVDLLEVKHTSPVQFIRNNQGSTRGAAFILYNSARIETLLRTFDTKVSRAEYPPMPAFDQINLNLLIQEEEWQLVFGYILAFPRLIQQCLEQLQQGKCAAHLIIRYLNSFMTIFSKYYRRVRVLTSNREHMMPVLYARIILIKAVRAVLNETLALIDIQPVCSM